MLTQALVHRIALRLDGGSAPITLIESHSLTGLATATSHPFATWPVRDVPAVAAGVYTIWNDERLVYVGMAGRSLTIESAATYTAAARRTGLFSRLNSHASGRRSGDQFCVYVADRLVLPQLQPQTLARIGKGEESFDRLIRDYIRKHLSFKYVITADGVEARLLEQQVRTGALGQKPILNPA